LGALGAVIFGAGGGAGALGAAGMGGMANAGGAIDGAVDSLDSPAGSAEGFMLFTEIISV